MPRRQRGTGVGKSLKLRRRKLPDIVPGALHWGHGVTLSDIASVANVVSSAAVLISLVYLSLQLRQGSRHQRATIHHDRLGHTEQYLAAVFGSPELMDLQVRGQAADRTLDDLQSNRFVFMQYANLLFYQEYFLLRQDGLLEEDRYTHNIGNLRLLAAEPGTRAAWRLLRPIFAPAFVAFLDRTMEETQPVENARFFAAAFKEAAAAELARARVATKA
jgi:hypothetical protein